MSTRGKVVVWLLVLIPLTAIVIAALAAPGEPEKDYHFPRVLIDATVNPDGSLSLDERRTWDFTGDFTYITYSIDWPIDRIEGFEVSENGRPILTVPTGSPAGVDATWTFDARDEVRTFRIRYRALCAVDVYRDSAHLLWQFVGTGHDRVTDLVRVRLHLPEAATGVVPHRPTPAPPRPVRATSEPVPSERARSGRGVTALWRAGSASSTPRPSSWSSGVFSPSRSSRARSCSRTPRSRSPRSRAVRRSIGSCRRSVGSRRTPTPSAVSTASRACWSSC